MATEHPAVMMHRLMQEKHNNLLEIERLRQWLQRIEGGTYCPWKAAKAALTGKNPDYAYERD